MAERKLIKVITILVFAVVILVPLFYIPPSIYPFVFDKAPFFQALVEVLFGLWLVFVISPISRLSLISPIGRIRRISPILLVLAIFVAALILTAFTGVDVWRSFFSSYERAYGVFGIMHMAALAVVLASLRKELPWRWIFAASIATSAVVAVLAGLEFYYDNNLLLDQPLDRAGATFGNPTFLAGYLSWNIFLALYFLFRRPSADDSQLQLITADYNSNGLSKFFFSRPWTALVVFLDAYTLVFITQTRGNILGLVFGIFVLLVLFAIHPPGSENSVAAKLFSSRRTYAALVIFIVFFGGIFWFTRANDFWTKIPGIKRFREISLTSEGLQPRFIAMRAAWEGFLERPLLGIGPENFNVVFNKHYDPKALRANYKETRFDKPHNFLLEDLATGGAALTATHLLFLATFLWAAMRLKDKLFGQVATAAFAAYFVGNLFIFSTIGSDLLLFVLVGFLAGSSPNNESSPNLRIKSEFADSQQIRYSLIRRGGINLTVFLATLLASLAFAYLVNINTMRASYSLFWAFHDTARGIDTERTRLPRGINNFRYALAIWHPYRWNFARDYAAVMSQTYFYNPEIIPKEAVLEAIGEMEKVAKEHPYDAYNHYALVDMYNQVSDIDPQRFLPMAEREAAIALKLSPDRQQIYFSLAKTKTLQNDYPAALELVRYALALDDQVPDAHFYYGLISFAAGDKETGYLAVKRALELGRTWKNFYEPLTVGNQFAEMGRLDEAIGFYEKAVELAPEDIESRTKLGIAYYFASRTEDARRELERASEKFDFRESVRFEDLKPILDELGIRY